MDTGTRSDVVVIGGGIAGLMTANRAAQLGLTVTVLEQGADEKYLCNTRYTGGTFHVCLREITQDEALLKRTILESTGGFVAEGLAEAIARDGRRVVRWLQEDGIKFMRASASEYHQWVLAPPGRSRPGLDWEGRGGDVLLRTLEANLLRRGGRFLRGYRAEALISDGDDCIGVIATHGASSSRFRSQAVVIADGGFQGDPELVQRYITRRPDRLKQRGAGTGRGDGLRMAGALGAGLAGMDRFYGHLLSRDALQNDNLWPYPYLDNLATAGIVVDAAGQRFVDEGGGGVSITNAISRLDDPLTAFAIVDHAIWEGPGRNGLIPANPHLEKVGGTMHRAGDLRELARIAGLSREHLAATVHVYNEALDSGALQALAPPRRSSRYAACPVRQPPFYAVPLCAGITYTMGGITVNEHSQALRTDGTIIQGLYAVGASTGGLEGGPAIGYVGGLAKGGVTGLRAAEHIARVIKGCPPSSLSGFRPDKLLN